MIKHLYVYMLKCCDNSYYVGVTNDVNRRLYEHNLGENATSYTFNRRPVELVYFQLFSDYNQAINWETQLKKWSRKKKEALIMENWNKIKELSECKNETTHKNFEES
jgi:putative endonuclease